MLTLFKTLDSIIHGSCTSNDRIVNTLYYYQRALKEHPRDIKLLFATGHVYCKLGRYEMALEYLNKCIVIRKKQPEPAPAWPITLG